MKFEIDIASYAQRHHFPGVGMRGGRSDPWVRENDCWEIFYLLRIKVDWFW